MTLSEYIKVHAGILHLSLVILQTNSHLQFLWLEATRECF